MQRRHAGAAQADAMQRRHAGAAQADAMQRRHAGAAQAYAMQRRCAGAAQAYAMQRRCAAKTQQSFLSASQKEKVHPEKTVRRSVAGTPVRSRKTAWLCLCGWPCHPEHTRSKHIPVIACCLLSTTTSAKSHRNSKQNPCQGVASRSPRQACRRNQCHPGLDRTQ